MAHLFSMSPARFQSGLALAFSACCGKIKREAMDTSIRTSARVSATCPQVDIGRQLKGGGGGGRIRRADLLLVVQLGFRLGDQRAEFFPRHGHDTALGLVHCLPARQARGDAGNLVGLSRYVRDSRAARGRRQAPGRRCPCAHDLLCYRHALLGVLHGLRREQGALCCEHLCGRSFFLDVCRLSIQ